MKSNGDPIELANCIAAHRDVTLGQCEIELRLGAYSENSFFPGVSKEVFEQLERDLHDSPSLTTDNKWVEVIDYHYMNQKSEPTRTRVEFDTEEMQLKTIHTSKQPQEYFVFGRIDDGDEACKVARSLEIPLQVTPSTCMPTHVRIKQRKCFHDIRDGNVVWCYELSKTWSGSNRTSVEHAHHVSEPVYEVECELVDNDGSYVQSRSDEEIAESLLMKAKMFMGEDPSCEVKCINAHVHNSKKKPGRRVR